VPGERFKEILDKLSSYVKGDPIFTIIEPKGRPKKEEEQK
jgi:hypothetical protein